MPSHNITTVPTHHEYTIKVHTGDQVNAGTDANVRVILHDINGLSSPEYKLDNWLKNDFEKGQVDKFTVKVPTKSCVLDRVHKLEIWRDNHWLGSRWYVKGVNVYDKSRGYKSSFPFHRWVEGHVHYVIIEWDTCIPQMEARKEQRRVELVEKQKRYLLKIKAVGLPAQVQTMPEDETFSWEYKWDIIKRKAKLILRSKIVNMFSSSWESLDQMKNVYTKNTLPMPQGAIEWKSDLSFARQRTHGCSIGLIELCREIPDKLGVTDEMMKPLLEGMSLSEAVAANRLFMVDLKILIGLQKKEGYHICCPVALFFENKDKDLTPVAIQLEQDKGPDNPIFHPTDPEYTWLMAKMWYNNADAIYHQSCTHLALTHLIMEGVCVSANRQLSQSHPIYKLLAPHFLFLIAINSRGLEVLISEGGWVDKTMSCGIVGMFDLINRATNAWHMDVDGTVPEDMKRRGLDTGAGHEFPYRDDAMLLYKITRNYVTKIVNHYYDTPDKLIGDWEIQAWGKEMVLSKEEGGVGIKGVPGNGEFTTNEQVITMLTSIIITCSVSHAASNFPQYDQYAFPPNYPAMINGMPPKDKEAMTEKDVVAHSQTKATTLDSMVVTKMIPTDRDTESTALTEKDVVASLPDKATTLDIMVVTKILSDRGTKSLSDFEVTYVFDPPAKEFVREFREELKEAEATIDERNKLRKVEYTVLHPTCVPNSISI